ncbi:hypothetical protein BGZ98_007822, partial [Dissophora globulifera]
MPRPSTLLTLTNISGRYSMLTSKKQLVTIAIALVAMVLGVAAAEDPTCTVTHPTSGKFYDLRPLIRKDSDQDWSPDTGADKATEYKLNICHTVLKKDLDVKFPEDIASWGKRDKGRSLG